MFQHVKNGCDNDKMEIKFYLQLALGVDVENVTLSFNDLFFKSGLKVISTAER